MSDPTMPNEAVETPEVLESQTDQAPAADETEEPSLAEGEAAEGEGEAEPEEVEFKFGANTIKLRKDAMPDDLREQVQKFVNDAESSTTRKSQELSEMRKSVEARAEAVLKFQKLNAELQDKFSEGMAIRKELTQWEQVNLNALWQSNPDEARRVSDHLNAQRGKLQNIIAEVNRAEMMMGQAQSAEVIRQEREGRELLERKVKGFSQKAPEVIEYAVKEFGVDRKEAEQYGLNPVAALAMLKAMQYDRMMAAAKKPAKTTTQVTPVTGKVTGGAARPQKDISQMSMTEYAEHMNKLDRTAQAKRQR